MAFTWCNVLFRFPISPANQHYRASQVVHVNDLDVLVKRRWWMSNKCGTSLRTLFPAVANWHQNFSHRANGFFVDFLGKDTHFKWSLFIKKLWGRRSSANANFVGCDGLFLLWRLARQVNLHGSKGQKTLQSHMPGDYQICSGVLIDSCLPLTMYRLVRRRRTNARAALAHFGRVWPRYWKSSMHLGPPGLEVMYSKPKLTYVNQSIPSPIGMLPYEKASGPAWGSACCSEESQRVGEWEECHCGAAHFVCELKR